VVDPGIEFGKLFAHDVELLRRLDQLHALRLPVLVAVSRKFFIGHALGGAPPAERLEGTAAAVAFAITRGAHVVRVHDVREMVRVARVTEALLGLTFSGPEGRVRSDGVLVP
ncbi:MAG TPA: dihydropteroate synthase, partial [Chloroflexota bacterium]|nr:dihydropteroate synthase [Chloroflexota bacterium]